MESNMIISWIIIHYQEGDTRKAFVEAQERRRQKVETGVVDLGQEGMVPMETNMIMEEMMDDGLDDACTIA